MSIIAFHIVVSIRAFSIGTNCPHFKQIVFSNGPSMNANGPAIWGGCVTRRKHRAGSWYFSQKTVTVQGGYGALFAVRVQILLSITRVAVQV